MNEVVRHLCEPELHQQVRAAPRVDSKNASRAISSAVLGQSWQMLNLADFSHTSASGQLMADGAIYDIYASQDAFELKPSLSNKVAMDLQDQVAPNGPADCDPVTSPVNTPSGAVEYRAPNSAPVTPARGSGHRRSSSRKRAELSGSRPCRRAPSR